MADRFYLRHVDLGGGNVFSQVRDLSASTNTEYLINFASGAPYPGHVSVAKQRPAIAMGTEQLLTVFTLAGVGGYAVSSCTAYFQQQTNRAARTAGGTSAHRAIQLNNSLLWWDSLTANAADTAISMTVNIEPTYNGTNAPMAALGSQTFTPNDAVAQKYCLGKVVINGTVIDEVDGIDLQMNHSIKRGENGATGVAYNPFIAIMSTSPQVTIRSPRVVDWAGVLAAPSPVASNVDIYLRRKENDRAFYADNTTNHILLRIANGVVGPEDVRSGGSDSAMAAIRVVARSAGSDAAPLAITTGVTIP